VKKNNLFISLFVLLLASLPLPLLVSTIVLVIIVLYAIYYKINNSIELQWSKEIILFFVFYLIISTSYFWSIDQKLSVIGIGRKVTFIIIPLLFSIIPPFTKTTREKLFHWFVLVLNIYAFFFISLGLIHYFKTTSFENLTHHKLVSPLGLNRIYISLFTGVGILYLLFEEQKQKFKLVSLIILSVFLILLSSKTIVIITLLLSALLLIKKQKINYLKKYKFIIPLLFVLITATIYVSNKVNPKFLSELNPKLTEVLNKTDYENNHYFNGADLRILYTRFLIEYEKENPILLIKGFGVNASQEKINEKCIKYRVPEGYGTVFNFHSQYNQTLAETGIISLFIILFLLFLNLKKSYLSFDYFGFSTILLIAALMTTESIFNRQRGIYFFLIIYFIIINTKTSSFNNSK
jgi:hypothetical protein